MKKGIFSKVIASLSAMSMVSVGLVMPTASAAEDTDFTVPITVGIYSIAGDADGDTTAVTDPGLAQGGYIVGYQITTSRGGKLRHRRNFPIHSLRSSKRRRSVRLMQKSMKRLYMR